jgi:predicted transposase YdaD
MAEKLSSPHDACFQTLMQQPENALAFFRHYLAPEWQQRVDLSTLRLDSGSSITTELEKLHSDILYRVALRDPENQGETAYLYTIVEHQSTPDKTMALRLWRYKANLLMRHVDDDVLPPIHTLVFYHGHRSPYPYNLDLSQCFASDADAQHTLQGMPQLIDVPQQLDAELLSTGRAGLVSYFFKHVRDKDVLPALIALPAALLRRITDESGGLMLLETLINYYQAQASTRDSLQAIQQVADKLEPQQREEIMKLGEGLIARGRQEGRQEGEQQGVYKVAVNMLRAGTESGFIQRMTGLSSADIQKLAANG